MALFWLDSRRYEMLMSVCFPCLCNSTHRKLRCVGNFNRYRGTYTNWLMMHVALRTRRGNVCVRICSATQQSSRTELYTSGTECRTVLVGSRVQLQESVSAGSGSRGVSCLSSLSLNDYSRCVVI